MIVMTCIIWIEGSRYDGGEVLCGMHQAEIKYSSMFACKSNIKRYEKYVEINSACFGSYWRKWRYY